MAYSKTRKNARHQANSEGRPFKNFLSKVSSKVGVENKNFYELEAGEVVDVILDSSHPDYMKTSDLGSCKLRLINSEFDLGKKQLNWYRCMDAQIKCYPMIGEYVVASQYMGKLFWSNALNLLGSINNNCMFHFTTGTKIDHGLLKAASGAGYAESSAAGSTKNNVSDYLPGDLFQANNMLSPLKAFEGHMMFNGRFGQSIRFGSRARLATQKGYQSKAGKDPYKSPHILIRTGPLFDSKSSKLTGGKFKGFGSPIEENINDDASSIWLTTKEDVPLAIATSKSKQKPFTSIKKPRGYDGQQIVLNSDRIIFNTKKKQFLCFSKGDIYFHTNRQYGLDVAGKIKINNKDIFDIKTDKKFIVFAKEKVNIDAKKNINFGNKKGELLAKGETLQKLLEELIEAIKQTISPAAAVAGPYPVSLTNPAFLDKVKAKLNTMLSDRVTTV